ncbi:MAG TPA: Rieske 2Fe-2S domain-containing protein [Candidatus Limnocylindria bacterium]|nr:Rieske 2Fe-2S domain-containing protein [Candidatus Limnocylindria bacterium]
MDGTDVMAIPAGLLAAGVESGEYVPVLRAAELPRGAMRRFTLGDADLLILNSERGLAAIDDRCPHMAAPLSLGALEGCVVACPLHSGRFDVSTGGVVQFPTTGGLDADGAYHPPWISPGAAPKPEPTDLKARARAATRVRRLRYYPLRVRDGMIEVRLPVGG